MNKTNTENIVIEGINHITFNVSNLEKSIDFYKIIFGEKVVAKSDLH